MIEGRKRGSVIRKASRPSPKLKSHPSNLHLQDPSWHVYMISAASGLGAGFPRPWHAGQHPGCGRCDWRRLSSKDTPRAKSALRRHGYGIRRGRRPRPPYIPKGTCCIRFSSGLDSTPLHLWISVCVFFVYTLRISSLKTRTVIRRTAAHTSYYTWYFFMWQQWTF